MRLSIAKHIRSLRKRAGLTQEELAQRLYVTRQTVSLWELGKPGPTWRPSRPLPTAWGGSAPGALRTGADCGPGHHTPAYGMGGGERRSRGAALGHDDPGAQLDWPAGTDWLGLVCACGQRISLDGIVWLPPSGTAVRDVDGKNFEPRAHLPPAAVDEDWTGGSGDMDHLLCEPADTAAPGQFGCLADAESSVAVSAPGAVLPPELAVVAAHVGPETRKRALRGISERVLIAYRHRR